MDEELKVPLDEPAIEPVGPRPDHIPEKFWDETAGKLRVDALMSSYKALEQKLSADRSSPHGAETEPDTTDGHAVSAAIAEEYDIATEHGLFEPDPGINGLLRDAGFTQDQAQMVYDLAAHVLYPFMASQDQHRDATIDEARLAEQFGGPEQWSEMQRQLRNWGQRHLPPDAYEVLSMTYDGVLAMHRMMQNDEPSVLRGRDMARPAGEGALRQLIRDPRYWRDRDPAIVREVSEGFRKLYPERP